jgi:cytoskeletal protein CcmA (bactofilin family)
MLKRKEKSHVDSPERLNRLVDGTKIVGDIFSESNLRIDGEVQGNISTKGKVVIGENGVVNGNLTCQEADIEGKIGGKLSIEGLLILRETANVAGDIQTARLHMEEGALFLGSCAMRNASSKENTTSIPLENRTEHLVN